MKYQVLKGIMVGKKIISPNLKPIYKDFPKDKKIIGFQLIDPPVFVELPPANTISSDPAELRDRTNPMITKEKWDATIKELIETEHIKPVQGGPQRKPEVKDEEK